MPVATNAVVVPAGSAAESDSREARKHTSVYVFFVPINVDDVSRWFQDGFKMIRFNHLKDTAAAPGSQIKLSWLITRLTMIFLLYYIYNGVHQPPCLPYLVISHRMTHSYKFCSIVKHFSLNMFLPCKNT